MDLQLKGKKALVCAASRGLGRAVAESLAEEGCELFICSRDADAIGKVAEELAKKYGVTVHKAAVDLGQPQNISEFHDTVVKEMGHVDILVNNIGGPPPSAAVSTELCAWKQGFDQVFLSSTLLTQSFVGGMTQGGFGRIVTVTSLSVVEPIPHLVVSTAMRSAVTAFSKTLSTEVAASGVTVNTVMPGVIHTGRIEKLREAKAAREGTTLREEIEKTENTIPTKRLGRPEEFAAMVTFICSPKASYITGMNFAVDGGLRRGN